MPSFAQEDQTENGALKLRERMIQYIQDKLAMSKSEADRFTPVFINYFRELRQTNQQYRGDRLVLQQKIVELRLRYRELFKPIIGDQRSNEVFIHEREFIQKAREELQTRLQNRSD